MGNPQLFSFDVPRRCQTLINDLWTTVSEGREDGSLPLNATFLLAISTPMVNLPIERIWKPQQGRAVGHLNDAVINPKLAAAIRTGIGPTSVLQAPFFSSAAWRYHYLAKGAGFPDLSQNGLPHPVVSALASDAAGKSAMTLSTELFCSILRNGLAHGGVMYLDENGRTAEGAPVRMFCFVSTKRDKRSRVVGLHFLRIRMKDYREFLQLWTKWLQASAV